MLDKKDMQQIINVVDFRKSPGEVLNKVFYERKKIILEKSKKKLAVLLPIDLYNKLFEDEDIEIYSEKRRKEFGKEDKLTKSLLSKIRNLLK